MSEKLTSVGTRLTKEELLQPYWTCAKPMEPKKTMERSARNHSMDQLMGAMWHDINQTHCDGDGDDPHSVHDLVRNLLVSHPSKLYPFGLLHEQEKGYIQELKRLRACNKSKSRKRVPRDGSGHTQKFKKTGRIAKLEALLLQLDRKMQVVVDFVYTIRSVYTKKEIKSALYDLV